MEEKELWRCYYDWLINEAMPDKTIRDTYSKLLDKLFNTVFYYSIPLDENREQDGVNLRYIYGYYNNISVDLISKNIDIRPCSLLEMMVALCKKCEDNIMEDSDVGNRVGVWFWYMLYSIGISKMEDDYYNDIFVTFRLDRLLNRQYDRNGYGGLFIVSNLPPNYDMTKIEIWYQMCLYLDSLTGSL